MILVLCIYSRPAAIKPARRVHPRAFAGLDYETKKTRLVERRVGGSRPWRPFGLLLSRNNSFYYTIGPAYFFVAGPPLKKIIVEILSFFRYLYCLGY